MAKQTAAEKAKAAEAASAEKIATANETFVAAKEAAVKPSRGETVTVASKLPHGMSLRLFRMVPRNELVLGGGTREFKQAEQVGDIVTINGTAIPFGEQPRCLVVGGYAMTPNVNAEFMRKWMEDNADHDAVRNNLLFIAKSADHAGGQAKEQSALRSGFEAINPVHKRNGRYVDPRMPNKIEKINSESNAAA